MAIFDPNIEPANSMAPQREQRHRKLIHAEIELETGFRYPATITNLSEHGLGLKTKCALEPFQIVNVIKAGYGRVKGEVRWTDGVHAGLLTSDPINVDMFNFAHSNDRGHFIPEYKNGHVWTGFEYDGPTRRPGVTGRFSDQD